MAFTGKLGTNRSRLGNIELGHKPVSVFTESFSDTLMFSDLVVSTYLILDSITFTDVILEIHQQHDTLPFSETMIGQKIAVGSFTDTLVFTDYLVFQFKDTVTFTDTFTGVIQRLGPMSETLTFSDTESEHHVSLRTFFETVNFNESMTRHMVRAVSMTDTLTFSDTETEYVTHPFHDTLTFADTETEFIAKKFTDFIDWDSLLSYDAIFHRNTADQFVVFDSLTYNAILRKTISDSLTFADTFVGNKVRPLVPEAITFSDVVTTTVSKPLYETITLADTMTVIKVLNRTMQTDTLSFTDGLTSNHIIFSIIADSLPFSDSETGIRVKHGTMTDTVAFTDKEFRTLIEVLGTDALVFTETESVHTTFHRTLSDTLNLSESLTEKEIFRRSMSDTVPLSDGFMVKLVQGTPHSGPPDNVHQLPNGAYEGVITVRPQVVITGITRSIILPAPEFNDFEAGQGKIAIKRSMMGRFRVYAKRTDREKVNWHFVLPKFKADELEAFILAEINNDLDITDFKGNKWHAKVLSDSVDFTETGRWSPCGNKVEVTLEFEGVKYA